MDNSVQSAFADALGIKNLLSCEMAIKNFNYWSTLYGETLATISDRDGEKKEILYKREKALFSKNVRYEIYDSNNLIVVGDNKNIAVFRENHKIASSTANFKIKIDFRCLRIRLDSVIHDSFCSVYLPRYFCTTDAYFNLKVQYQRNRSTFNKCVYKYISNTSESLFYENDLAPTCGNFQMCAIISILNAYAIGTLSPCD